MWKNSTTHHENSEKENKGALVKKERKEQVLVRMWRNWNSKHCWQKCKMIQPLLESNWGIPQKIKHSIII